MAAPHEELVLAAAQDFADYLRTSNKNNRFVNVTHPRWPIRVKDGKGKGQKSYLNTWGEESQCWIRDGRRLVLFTDLFSILFTALRKLRGKGNQTLLDHVRLTYHVERTDAVAAVKVWHKYNLSSLDPNNTAVWAAADGFDFATGYAEIHACTADMEARKPESEGSGEGEHFEAERDQLATVSGPVPNGTDHSAILAESPSKDLLGALQVEDTEDENSERGLWENNVVLDAQPIDFSKLSMGERDTDREIWDDLTLVDTLPKQGYESGSDAEVQVWDGHLLFGSVY